MLSRVPFAVAAAVFLLFDGGPAAAQVRVTTPVRVAAPIQSPIAPQSAAPMGLSVAMAPSGSLPGGQLKSPVSLGMASSYQLQLTAASQGAGAKMVGSPSTSLTGTIQFVAGDQQTQPAVQCFTTNCTLNSLAISNATGGGTTVVTLYNAKFTQVVTGSSIAVSFTAPKVGWQTFLPPGQTLGAASTLSLGAPQGISVSFQSAASVGEVAPQPTTLGMASTFQLQSIPSSPAAGGALQRGTAAAGTVTFMTGDPYSMFPVADCLMNSCVAHALTITSNTPQGTTVYSLANVRFAQIVIGVGTTPTMSFTYERMLWKTLPPGQSGIGTSTPTMKGGGWDYIQNQPISS